MPKPRLLICVSRFPYPLEKGDKLRAYHQIKVLSKSFEICLCALSNKNVSASQVEELEKFCSEVHVFQLNKLLIYWNVLKQFFTQKPFQVGYFYQKAIHRKMKKVSEDFRPAHIYCQLIRTTEYFKNEHSIPKTIDYMDALSKGMQRRIGSEGFLKNYFIKEEYKRLLKYESLIFDYFNFHTIISEQDQSYIFHAKKNEIAIVPNGIDTDFFQKRKTESKADIVFVGNMSYPPNVKAVKRIAKEILPLFNRKIKFLIAGANPSKEVLALNTDNVTVSGWVDDIRTSYLSAKIFVAPLEIGTGLQNKILEAMSLEIPCVTTPLVNNAIGAENKRELFLADSNREFVQVIESLLNDEVNVNQLGENARMFVKTTFDWENSSKQLIKFCSNQRI